MLLLHRCALSRFHMTDGQITHDQIPRVEVRGTCDQIAICTFHSFLVQVQIKAGYTLVTHA